MKIVVNGCFGGFGLSIAAIKKYLKLKGKKAFFYKSSYKNGKSLFNKVCNHNGLETFVHTTIKDLGKTPSSKEINKFYFSDGDIERDDPDLVKTVEKLGKKADGNCAKLEIREIPDDVDWEISNYDGVETIHEKHRCW